MQRAIESWLLTDFFPIKNSLFIHMLLIILCKDCASLLCFRRSYLEIDARPHPRGWLMAKIFYSLVYAHTLPNLSPLAQKGYRLRIKPEAQATFVDVFSTNN